MASPTFWDNQEKAQKTVADLTRLKAVVAPQLQLSAKVSDLSALFELAEESDDDPDLAAMRVFNAVFGGGVQRNHNNPRRRGRHGKLRLGGNAYAHVYALGGTPRLDGGN